MGSFGSAAKRTRLCISMSRGSKSLSSFFADLGSHLCPHVPSAPTRVANSLPASVSAYLGTVFAVDPSYGPDESQCLQSFRKHGAGDSRDTPANVVEAGAPNTEAPARRGESSDRPRPRGRALWSRTGRNPSLQYPSTMAATVRSGFRTCWGAWGSSARRTAPDQYFVWASRQNHKTHKQIGSKETTRRTK
jgi:hypothetical protein